MDEDVPLADSVRHEQTLSGWVKQLKEMVEIFSLSRGCILSLLLNSKMSTMGVAPDACVLLNPPVGLTPTSNLHLSVVEHSNIQLYL